MATKKGGMTRADRSSMALERLLLAGYSPEEIDPRLVLQSIAGDVSAPVMARVVAAKALLAEARAAGTPAASGPADDPVSARAIEILNRTRTRTVQ